MNWVVRPETLTLSPRLDATWVAMCAAIHGVHLLNGHLGKGQQFEWIVVAGLEEGTLPFFKATSDEEIREEARVLSVMVSRARHGVVLTRVRYSHGRRQGASRFLRDLEAAPTCLDGDGLAEWMETVDWAALAVRDGMG